MGPAASSISVKLMHTYDEFKTEDGLLVQLGAGLNLEQLAAAESFLRGDSEAALDLGELGAEVPDGKRKSEDAEATDGAKTDEQRPPSKALKLFKAPELKTHAS